MCKICGKRFVGYCPLNLIISIKKLLESNENRYWHFVLRYSSNILYTFYSHLWRGIVVKFAITPKILSIICVFRSLAGNTYYSLQLLRKLSKYIYNWNSTYIVIKWMVYILIFFQCSFQQVKASKCKFLSQAQHRRRGFFLK